MTDHDSHHSAYSDRDRRVREATALPAVNGATNRAINGVANGAAKAAINTFYSSRTEALTGILLSVLNDADARRRNPFARTRIVVPNSGMQRYLELQIAAHLGICSQIDIEFSSRFLRDCYRRVLGELADSVPYLDSRRLTFAVLAVWQSQEKLRGQFRGQSPQQLDSPLAKLLAQYHTPKQRYALAAQVAGLFVRYLNERPDLTAAWQRQQCVYAEQNPHEMWQMQLFNQLQLGRFSQTALQTRFHQGIHNARDANNTLPDVHLFGFHAMPPTQLADFAALSAVASVSAYIFNPSPHYWRDIVPPAVKASLELTAASEAELVTVGNPLLASWGQSGKYLIEQLNDNDSGGEPLNMDEALNAQGGAFAVNSVLDWVQDSIRDLSGQDTQDKQDTQNETATLSKDTTPNSHTADSLQRLQDLCRQEQQTRQFSLSLHVAAGARREVEILYDHLCALFDGDNASDNAIQPSDVLVMVANLRDYAPHIQAVFGGDARRSVPFSLANQTAAEADADTQAFLTLLTLIDEDFSARALSDAIGEAHIRRTFRLSLDTVQTMRYWLRESRYAQYFHDNSHGRSGSLEKLLDALLLADIGGDGCHVDTDTQGQRQAFRAYHGGQRDTLQAFCRLVTALSRFSRLKQRHETADGWRDVFYDLAERFLGENNDMMARLRHWHHSIVAEDSDSTTPAPMTMTATDDNDDDDDNGGDAVRQTRFDYETVTADLRELLQSEELHGPFLSGGVSFCAMVPMRSIPAKMIALLGLNSDFPRLPVKDPLDLRHVQPLWSDRNPHKEYKYFFLETLMAARQRLYLSYIGQDEHSGETLPPSILVDELFGFVAKQCPEYLTAATQHYPIQGFLGQGFLGQESLGQGFATYQRLYFADNHPTDTQAITATPSTPSIPTPQNKTFSDIEQLSGRVLADALCEPLWFYLRYALSAQPIALPDNTVSEHDMVALDSGLDAWIYKNSVLHQTLFDSEDEQSLHALQAQNRYAPESISQALFDEQRQQLAPMLSALQALTTKPHAPLSRFVSFRRDDGSDFHALLTIKHHGEDGAWDYALSPLNASKLLRLWVNHVLLNQDTTALPKRPSYPHITNANTAFTDAPCRKTSSMQRCHSRLLTIEKNQQVQTTHLMPLSSEQATSALAHLLALAERLFAVPYAVTLSLATKKDATMCVYKNNDYPLYPRLMRQAKTADDETLCRLWQAVDDDMRQAIINDDEQ